VRTGAGKVHYRGMYVQRGSSKEARGLSGRAAAQGQSLKYPACTERQQKADGL
jgi:hypothetical protein